MNLEGPVTENKGASTSIHNYYYNENRIVYQEL